MVHHALKSHRSRVGDIRKDGVFEIVINFFENSRGEEPSQFLSFLVNVFVGTARKIDPFKRTRFHRLGIDKWSQRNFTIFLHDQRMTGSELFYLVPA